MKLIQTCRAAPVLLALAACNQTAQTDAAVVAASKKTEALEQQVSALSKQLDESKTSVASLQTQISVLQIQTQGIWESSPFVLLDPTTRAYSVVKTNLG